MLALRALFVYPLFNNFIALSINRLIWFGVFYPNLYSFFLFIFIFTRPFFKSLLLFALFTFSRYAAVCFGIQKLFAVRLYKTASLRSGIQYLKRPEFIIRFHLFTVIAAAVVRMYAYFLFFIIIRPNYPLFCSVTAPFQYRAYLRHRHIFPVQLFTANRVKTFYVHYRPYLFVHRLHNRGICHRFLLFSMVFNAFVKQFVLYPPALRIDRKVGHIYNKTYRHQYRYAFHKKPAPPVLAKIIHDFFFHFHGSSRSFFIFIFFIQKNSRLRNLLNRESFYYSVNDYYILMRIFPSYHTQNK